MHLFLAIKVSEVSIIARQAALAPRLDYFEYSSNGNECKGWPLMTRNNKKCIAYMDLE